MIGLEDIFWQRRFWVVAIGRLQRFVRGDWLGVRFAVNIFIATTILWLMLHQTVGLNPIWAVSSMVAASDPVVGQAVSTLRGRIINAVLGCAVGFSFLVLGGSREWKLPLAMAVTVLLSTYVVRVQVMWRQAPITAAIVIAAGMSHSSKLTALEIGVRRVGEVLLGCVVGVTTSWLVSILWTPPEPRKEDDSGKPSSPPDQIASILPTSKP
jgi:uncharacterized membrane protein YccC